MPTDKPSKHYFFLNPYDDCAFTKCPKCTQKTFLRKFPLVVHVEPQQLVVLNKKCKYCTKCDLIIAKQSEVEALLCEALEKTNPSVIGNEYLVFGTLEKKDWKRHSKEEMHPKESIQDVHVFTDVLKFEVEYGGWHRE